MYLCTSHAYTERRIVASSVDIYSLAKSVRNKPRSRCPTGVISSVLVADVCFLRCCVYLLDKVAKERRTSLWYICGDLAFPSEHTSTIVWAVFGSTRRHFTCAFFILSIDIHTMSVSNDKHRTGIRCAAMYFPCWHQTKNHFSVFRFPWAQTKPVQLVGLWIMWVGRQGILVYKHAH